MPRDITLTFEDGATHVYKGVPDEATPEQVTARAGKDFAGKRVTALDGGRKPAKQVTFSEAAAHELQNDPLVAGLAGLGAGVKDVAMGAQHWLGRGIRAAGGIGQAPSLSSLITGPQQNAVQRAGQWLIDDAAAGNVGTTAELAPYKEASPIATGTGRIGGNVVATLPIGPMAGGALSSLLGKVGLEAPALANALRTAGMSTGAEATTLGARALDMGTRVAAGGAVGGASAGLIDPAQAETGAMIGAALPPAVAAAGKVGQLVGQGVRAVGAKVLPQSSPEVTALAARAKELGIDVPADRLVSSKPLDAVASGLNYVPFSGRSGSEARMVTQLNQAVSRTMGQDTPNISLALRKAGEKLGAEFDRVLKGTGVALDKQALEDFARVFNPAEKELGADALKPIASQVDDLIAKGATGTIDGQAAYNIKRTLDRIGSGNTPTAYHALELKRVLMDALNRSLGTEAAAAFATTRQQYGNMLALQKLAKNGVEGEISAARLANLQNINNQPLQELADIAAQFVKPREGQHGAMQRAVAGMAGLPAAASTLGLPGAIGVAGVSGAARGTNALLNSQAMRRLITGEAAPAAEMLVGPEALYRLTGPATGAAGR